MKKTPLFPSKSTNENVFTESASSNKDKNLSMFAEKQVEKDTSSQISDPTDLGKQANVTASQSEPEDLKSSLAKDMFLNADHITQGLTPKNSTKDKDNVEAITENIRENILLKQQELIKSWLLENTKDEEEKKKIQANLAKYLKDNPDHHEKLFSSIKKDLEKIEFEGYKKHYEVFKDNYQNINWEDNKTNDKTRSKELLDKNGNKIGTLTETNISENGINFRKVDFPLKLDAGPMHIALAVKDADGKNIAEDKAVYFTAHYGKDGKLEEVSSTQPVKFKSNDKNAIGYVEIDGKEYTLPVTKQKYEEMMKTVAINKGVSMDLSVTNVIESQDLVLTKKIGPAKENNKVLDRQSDIGRASNIKDSNLPLPQIEAEVKQELSNKWVSAKPTAAALSKQSSVEENVLDKTYGIKVDEITTTKKIEKEPDKTGAATKENGPKRLNSNKNKTSLVKDEKSITAHDKAEAIKAVLETKQGITPEKNKRNSFSPSPTPLSKNEEKLTIKK